MGAVLAGAAVIGVALGLFGAGGSILTVPLLAYGVGLPEKTAVASALAIVGALAAFGALLQARLALDVHVIGPFIGAGILGLILGRAECERLPRQQLRPGFVLLLLSIAGLVLWRAAAA